MEMVKAPQESNVLKLLTLQSHFPVSLTFFLSMEMTFDQIVVDHHAFEVE